MPLKANFKAKFKKELNKLSKNDQRDINIEINNFLAGKKVDIRRLNSTEWRPKVNDLRVLFLYNGDIISFTSVETRTTTTYRKR